MKEAIDYNFNTSSDNYQLTDHNAIEEHFLHQKIAFLSKYKVNIYFSVLNHKIINVF